MLQCYETVCKGFGENPQRIEPQEFFKYFSDFFLQVRGCFVEEDISCAGNFYFRKALMLWI